MSTVAVSPAEWTRQWVEGRRSTAAPTSAEHARIGVLVVAYNAESTLVDTLDRLPTDFAERVSHVLVSDDASSDRTFTLAREYRERSSLPVTVRRQKVNRGYGGNQKDGYQWLADRCDIVVLLHADGQYAPEVIESLIAPIERGEADAVFGSRMLPPGAAREGGMPMYKFVGNRILTWLQNRASGVKLSEWHSGYRAYRVSTLTELGIDSYAEGFSFDTDIILGLIAAKKRISEVPIPTYYGNEICHVNGLAYARDVIKAVLSARFAPTMPSATDPYLTKVADNSSHRLLLGWLAGRAPVSVLDVGCSDGAFAGEVMSYGHEVDGTDLETHPGVERLRRFVAADLNAGLPDGLAETYDVVVAGDVAEHVLDPDALLQQIHARLADDGELLISVPNISHWYPRGRIAAGLFDYDERGPLDRGHVRFFTRRMFERTLRDAGFEIVERQYSGTPWELLPVPALVRRLVQVIDRFLVAARPTLFGYQFVYRARPRR
ncbi:hypothetical protein Back2_13650 [Nocardioides baekrokdamisoli]|uniref:Glycosyltransferase 2-like domain-containing protein n=1 Tax=Nocardioides baekrokdamisoli TaxID=1804624 RepID=A0A3G9J0B6_9ACTN|nr:bifunctional glycosyltransferase/class I SAM-dependent methyltransferase [Nocardioides baekrokdamisoli]BBH17078.1 hypothetical protein Back2_13650 [Nocardioides baekrokdamisoli]